MQRKQFIQRTVLFTLLSSFPVIRSLSNDINPDDLLFRLKSLLKEHGNCMKFIYSIPNPGVIYYARMFLILHEGNVWFAFEENVPLFDMEEKFYNYKSSYLCSKHKNMDTFLHIYNKFMDTYKMCLNGKDMYLPNEVVTDVSKYVPIH